MSKYQLSPICRRAISNAFLVVIFKISNNMNNFYEGIFIKFTQKVANPHKNEKQTKKIGHLWGYIVFLGVNFRVFKQPKHQYKHHHQSLHQSMH